MCRTFRCLPYEGGLMQQPGFMVVRMEKVLDAHSEAEEFKDKKELPK